MCDRCDAVVSEVRDIRRAISADLDHDLGRLVAYLRNSERRDGARLLTPLQIAALRARGPVAAIVDHPPQ